MALSNDKKKYVVTGEVLEKFNSKVKNKISSIDEDVVHKTGDETIIGNKTFNGTNNYNGFNIFNGIANDSGEKECITFPTGAIIANDKELKLYTHNNYNTFSNSTATYGLTGESGHIYNLSDMVRNGADQWGITGGKSWTGVHWFDNTLNCNHELWVNGYAQFKGNIDFINYLYFHDDLTPATDNTIMLGNASNRWKEVWSDYICTTNMNINAVIPKNGDGSGTVGDNTRNFNSVYAKNLYENNIKLENKYAKETAIDLGRNTDTSGVILACPFLTLTFPQVWENFCFELQIEDLESRKILGNYWISGRANDTTSNLNCEIQTIYKKNQNVFSIFAVQSNNVITFYVKTNDNYIAPRIWKNKYKSSRDSIVVNLTPGSWTQTIPTATWSETYILDERYVPKSGGTVMGNIFPSIDRGAALGYADKRFKDIYVETGHYNAIVPYENKTGSIGNSASKWLEVTAQYINGEILQENGVNIKDIYLQKDNTQSFNIRISQNSDYKIVSFDYDLGLNVEGNITTENTITSGWLSTDSLEIYSAEDEGDIPERIATINSEGLVGYRGFNDFKNDLGINKKYQHNITLSGAVDSSGVTRVIITFSFINNVSTAYTTVRGSLDTALYNAGFISSTKLCNASGNFIPNASSTYSAMGVSGSSSSGIIVYGNYGQTSNGNLTLGTATATIGYYSVTVTDTVVEI